jgi:hypothetical protein
MGPPHFAFQLRKDKLRQTRRREGRYLLGSNLSAQEPEKLWRFYIQLTQAIGLGTAAAIAAAHHAERPTADRPDGQTMKNDLPFELAGRRT